MNVKFVFCLTIIPNNTEARWAAVLSSRFVLLSSVVISFFRSYYCLCCSAE